jgi:hypothetical protein
MAKAKVKVVTPAKPAPGTIQLNPKHKGYSGSSQNAMHYQFMAGFVGKTVTQYKAAYLLNPPCLGTGKGKYAKAGKPQPVSGWLGFLTTPISKNNQLPGFIVTPAK